MVVIWLVNMRLSWCSWFMLLLSMVMCVLRFIVICSVLVFIMLVLSMMMCVVGMFGMLVISRLWLLCGFLRWVVVIWIDMWFVILFIGVSNGRLLLGFVMVLYVM